MTTPLPRALLLAAALLASAPARAADGFAAGPLGPYLLLGGEGIWQGALDGDTYGLANDNDANATTSLFVDPRGGGAPYWDISVEVRVGEEPGGMAGLLYGRQQEDPPFYLAFVVDAQGAASILQRNPGGLERLARFDKAQLIDGGFNTLRIVEGPGQFEVFVNGTRVGMAKTDVAGTGALGIFAGGRGRFQFRNFSLVPVPGGEADMAAAGPAGEDDAGQAAPAPEEKAATAAADPLAPAAAPAEVSAGAAAPDDGQTALDAFGYASAPPMQPPPVAAATRPLVTLPLPPKRPPEME